MTARLPDGVIFAQARTDRDLRLCRIEFLVVAAFGVSLKQPTPHCYH